MGEPFIKGFSVFIREVRADYASAYVRTTRLTLGPGDLFFLLLLGLVCSTSTSLVAYVGIRASVFALVGFVAG